MPEAYEKPGPIVEALALQTLVNSEFVPASLKVRALLRTLKEAGLLATRSEIEQLEAMITWYELGDEEYKRTLAQALKLLRDRKQRFTQ